MRKRTGTLQNAEIRLLLQAIDQGYEKKAWHGPNLRGSIRGVSPAAAAWRPAPGRHNIWEIVLHAAYWKYAVRRMLTGDPRGTFPLKGSNWFPCPAQLTLARWREASLLLAQEHSQLRAAIEDMQPSGLYQNGIASHDIYHAGQIQLLKRLFSGKG